MDATSRPEAVSRRFYDELGARGLEDRTRAEWDHAIVTRLARRASLVPRRIDAPTAFDAASFDAVICLWSAFNELLDPAEQLQAAREIVRVLRPGGWALVEGPPYVPASADQLACGARYGPAGRVSADVVAGLANPHYLHDRQTLTALARASGAVAHEVYEDDWAGRARLFLRLTR